MRKIVIVLAVLVLVSLACNLNMGRSSGGEVRMDEAGFSAYVPEGYEMSSFLGELSCNKAGAEMSTGPYFTINLGPPDPVYEDAEAILDNLVDSNNVFNYRYSGNRNPVTVNGNAGLAEDFTGTVEETGAEIAGRTVAAVLPDGRQLRFIGYWPANQQSEGETAFNELLNSIKFYEPVTPTTAP